MASTLGAGLEESSGAGECTSRGVYSEEFFPNVSKIAYEGPDSTNPLAFHYYNAEEVIMGKPMKDWCAPLSPPLHLMPFVNSWPLKQSRSVLHYLFFFFEKT